MTSPPTDQFLIPGTFNFRDVAGLRTVDGAKVRPGILLRSAQLSRLDAEGHAGLRQLGVGAVHDLRGLREIEHMGHDNLPDGVRLHVTPFDSRMGEAPPHDAQTSSAFEHMLEVYREFPSLPEAGTAIHALAESILRDEGAALVHCAAGKDRTGWAVAALLRAAQVTEADILADYLQSNGAVPMLRAMLAPKLAAGEELSDDLLGVRAEYLAAAIESVETRYGGFDNYLTQIGITPALRARLRRRMLE
ncbi:tyrosine-protein phosphatase [Nocardia sp. XZ_19_385]|uniref:tyrosine-protein phosphatase n=1 Tax=Nocardia sp. XZ_19_385 TaxID=2769488 RepID=UPI00188F961E|nr:tyrosine-protein phosphatase [Nocardia sp. XZ_19_385]